MSPNPVRVMKGSAHLVGALAFGSPCRGVPPWLAIGQVFRVCGGGVNKKRTREGKLGYNACQGDGMAQMQCKPNLTITGM